ncbi:MAG: AMP-binding protein, partial [Acidimicrobiales bacterium]
MNLAGVVTGHPADGRALYDRGGWSSWGDVRRRAGRAADGLRGLGVGPGDRVAIAWPTSVDFVVAYLAVLAVGAVAVPLNPNSPPAELVGELEAVTPPVLLAGAVAGGHAGEIGAGVGFALTTVRPGGTPGWESLAGTVGGADGDDGRELTVVERADEETAVLLFTSGTSGAPKAAMLSHGNLRANLEQMLALPGEIVRADDVSLAAVPLFHVFGLNVALGLTLMAGAGLILEERFDAADSLRLVRELGVTNVVGVPAMFAAWVALAEDDPSVVGPGALSGVRRAISGAAALPAEVAAGFEKAFGVPVWQGYGLTEAAPAVATSLGTGRNRPGSVGQPLPGLPVRLVAEAEQDVLDGDPGEIWVQGANVFAGYFGDAGASAEVLTPSGWL